MLRSDWLIYFLGEQLVSVVSSHPGTLLSIFHYFPWPIHLFEKTSAVFTTERLCSNRMFLLIINFKADKRVESFPDSPQLYCNYNRIKSTTCLFFNRNRVGGVRGKKTHHPVVSNRFIFPTGPARADRPYQQPY